MRELAVYILFRLYSSDLWVAGTVNNAQDTGKTSSVSYVGGEVQGMSVAACSLQLKSDLAFRRF